mmetsp:Transcript_9797/g.14315  ORF Transcript_9797/g.14315 Transcript_9797/m.14315 type:complete len:383 (+) Transcript_9797:885-2033(+)
MRKGTPLKIQKIKKNVPVANTSMKNVTKEATNGEVVIKSSDHHMEEKDKLQGTSSAHEVAGVDVVQHAASFPASTVHTELSNSILPTERDVLLSFDENDGSEGELRVSDSKEFGYHPANVLFFDLVSLRARLLPRQPPSSQKANDAKGHEDVTASTKEAAKAIVSIIQKGYAQHLPGFVNHEGTTSVSGRDNNGGAVVPTIPQKGRFLKMVEQTKSISSGPSLISFSVWGEASDDAVHRFVTSLLRRWSTAVGKTEVDDKFADADETDVSSKAATPPKANTERIDLQMPKMKEKAQTIRILPKLPRTLSWQMKMYSLSNQLQQVRQLTPSVHPTTISPIIQGICDFPRFFSTMWIHLVSLTFVHVHYRPIRGRRWHFRLWTL